MLVVETIAKTRRAYFSLGRPIKEICRELRVSRKVVRKVIRSDATEFHYERSRQPLPRIGPWRERLESLLEENKGKSAREQLTLIRLSRRSPLCDWLEGETRERDGERLCAADVRAARNLPVRLEPRDRCDGRGDDGREGRAEKSDISPQALCDRLLAERGVKA
jgi:hypothetical protein